MLKKIFRICGLAMVLGAAFTMGSLAGSNLNPETMNIASAAAEKSGFIGNWYNSRGKFVLSIQPGVINNCKVVRSYDVKPGNPGSGHYVILTAAGETDLFIEWEGGYVENEKYVEPHITLNHGEKLSRK